jgi:hypothetical protein
MLAMPSSTATALIGTALVTALASGCASRPEIRLDRNPSIEMSHYSTFAFAEPLSADKSLYTTLISGRLKKATRDALERRNYVYDETDPDLRADLSLSVVDRQELRSVPSNHALAYRLGLDEVQTVDYRQGTLQLDLIDPRLNEFVWQGVAEGRISRKSVENPGPAVDEAVSELLTGFPINRNGGDLVSQNASGS